jgi:7-keto-8-aminopelargonate synthetase-like enzyme
LFNSGYSANIGTMASLTATQDLIVADMLSHASILDGMRMSVATSRFFKHNNMGHLERILAESRASSMGALVVTEGVFSMDVSDEPWPRSARLDNGFYPPPPIRVRHPSPKA